MRTRCIIESLCCILFTGDKSTSLQFRIVTAPFHHVGFADFWLADQLNSLATVLLDLEYMVCFYAVEVDWHGKDSE